MSRSATPAPQVRPAQDADLDACAEILAQGYRSFMTSDAWDAALVERLIANIASGNLVRQMARHEHVLVAEQTSVICGFVSMRGHELTHLFISPSCRRQGIGQLLIEHAQTHARCAGYDQLRVYAAAFSAVAFYERSGFQVMGEMTIPGGPCAGRTALRLARSIL